MDGLGHAANNLALLNHAILKLKSEEDAIEAQKTSTSGKLYRYLFPKKVERDEERILELRREVEKAGKKVYGDEVMYSII